MELQPPLLIKEPICHTTRQRECAKNVQVHSNLCLKPCSGQIVTSFSKLNPRDKSDIERQVSEEMNVYGEHTKWVKYPKGSPGQDRLQAKDQLSLLM